uniref:Uncharacterized protein n=1 Tax=Panagrolaimus superbus TaxID=310955 RepID=A0A914YWA0_9BILA
MTDPAAIAGILSKCLKINVTFKGGNFCAHCDCVDSLITLLKNSSIKMTLLCFDITIFNKGNNKFAITNNGTFIGNIYAVKNDE